MDTHKGPVKKKLSFTSYISIANHTFDESRFGHKIWQKWSKMELGPSSHVMIYGIENSDEENTSSLTSITLRVSLMEWYKVWYIQAHFT